MSQIPLDDARDHFILGMTRIAHFWGFPKAMGAVFGCVYLSVEPISLAEIVEQVGVTKGAVSTHVRALERLGLLHKSSQLGDRRDFYTAESDFWKVIKGVLKEREKVEFDRALQSVDESLVMLKNTKPGKVDKKRADFYRDQLTEMKAFFGTLDHWVAMFLAMDDLRLGVLSRFSKKTKQSK